MEGTYPSRMNAPIEADQLVPRGYRPCASPLYRDRGPSSSRFGGPYRNRCFVNETPSGLQQAQKPERSSGRCVRPTTTPTSDHRFFTRPTGRSQVASSQANHSTKGSLRRVRQSARDWTCPT